MFHAISVAGGSIFTQPDNVAYDEIYIVIDIIGIK